MHRKADFCDGTTCSGFYHLITRITAESYIPILPAQEYSWLSRLRPLIFTLLERAGQITCLMMPILFGRLISAQTLGVSAVLMALCLLVYYGGWVRYFRSGRAFTALFKPWLGIPVPMAVFPALYFLLLGVWLQSWLFIVPACLFAAGHLVNSWSVYGQLR